MAQPLNRTFTSTRILYGLLEDRMPNLTSMHTQQGRKHEETTLSNVGLANYSSVIGANAPEVSSLPMQSQMYAYTTVNKRK